MLFVLCTVFLLFIVASVALGKQSYYNQWPESMFLDLSKQPITLSPVTPNLGLGNIAKNNDLSVF